MNFEYLVAEIEQRTDYDVLDWNDFTMDVMNRNGFDDKRDTIRIYGKSIEEIISAINKL